MKNQQCTRCIYDKRIPHISFNVDGVCNYCEQYDQLDTTYPTDEIGEQKLLEMVDQIKKDGKNKKYDLIIGVSGGCDSSYMVHLAVKKHSLRPLAVHFDNTYNTKIAVENIQRVLAKLNVDLYTHVVDNKEFSRISRSFFLASVPEIDTPTDLALAATLYSVAAKYGIKHIWEGHSFRTEGISPPGWFYMDAQYVQSVHSQYGDGKIQTLPQLKLLKWLKWMLWNGIKKHRPLYYMNYNKEETKAFLQKEYAWQWYGGHHMENRTSYFTNNYYLPKKFKIDLRWCEYSALVRSKQMSRDQALDLIGQPKQFDESILAEIKKRNQFSDMDWDRIMNSEPMHYTSHKTYKPTFEKYRFFFEILYKLGYVTFSFYQKFCVLKEKEQKSFPLFDEENLDS